LKSSGLRRLFGRNRADGTEEFSRRERRKRKIRLGIGKGELKKGVTPLQQEPSKAPSQSRKN